MVTHLTEKVGLFTEASKVINLYQEGSLTIPTTGIIENTNGNAKTSSMKHWGPIGLRASCPR